MSKSITRWFGRGDAAVLEARLDAELHEVLSALLPRIAQGQLESVAVASADTGEGRTLVAMNIAEALADQLTGDKVLLVDADSQRPRLHREVQADGEVGFAQVLRGEVPFETVVQSWVAGRLDVLPAGTREPLRADDLTPTAWSAFMAAVRPQYRLAVIDTAPLLTSQEAGLVCGLASDTLLVVLAGLTQGEFVARAHRVLLRAKAQVLGVVVNDPRDEFKRDET